MCNRAATRSRLFAVIAVTQTGVSDTERNSFSRSSYIAHLAVLVICGVNLTGSLGGRRVDPESVVGSRGVVC